MKKILILLLVLCPVLSLLSQDVYQKADELLTAYSKLGRFNGSALITQHGKVILEKGYGFKNFKEGTLNDSNSVFEIASVTKQFTAALILKLVELNKMALSDKLTRYYPDFPKGDSITIENLLTHTSGITDKPVDSATRSRIDPSLKGMQKFLAQVKSKPLAFSPGEGWQYSNSGYILLGYIIQQVTNMTYYKAIRKFIFIPLQMTHSGFNFGSLPSSERATGYSIFSDSAKTEAPMVDSAGPFAAGAIYSTVGDLYRWHEGLQSYKIIGKASLDRAYTPFRNNYGYGWEIHEFSGKKILEHGGNIDGFTSDITRSVDDDMCIVLLNNREQSPLKLIARKIYGILNNEPYNIPVKRQEIKLSEEILARYAGTWSVDSARQIFVITVENGHLMLKAKGPGKIELFAYKENFFFFKGPEEELEFIPEGIGKINSCIFHQNGRDEPGIRIN